MYIQLGFPEAILEAGEERTIYASVEGLFRPQRFVVVGLMDEIRGHFRIKRSRLPLLNRENVIGCSSNRPRNQSRRRTTVEFLHPGKNKVVVRTYLPSSVEYIPTDALSYILLQQVFCDDAHQMPNGGVGVSALFFRPEVLGNGIYLSTAKKISCVLKNIGDIRVRVFASMFGMER